MKRLDEGQVLIKASDCLFDCASELKETQPELAKILENMGLEIGTVFNKLGSHRFYLRSKENP